MKKLTDFLRKRPLMWFALTLALSIVIVFLLAMYDRGKTAPSNDFISRKIEIYKDRIGEQRARVETVQNDKSQFDKQEIEKLKKALNVKENEIKAITELKGKIRDSVKLLAVQLDAEKHKVWTWEKKYKSGSVFRATMNEKDSVLIAEADLKVQTADIEEGRGKKKKFYTEFYTPDQNIKFNGARTYRVERKEIKDILQVDLKAGFRKGFLINDYDQLESTLQVIVLPDNEFNFGFGAGGIYIVKDGRIFPYGEIFLRKNLFRIRGR